MNRSIVNLETAGSDLLRTRLPAAPLVSRRCAQDYPSKPIRVIVPNAREASPTLPPDWYGQAVGEPSAAS